MSARVAWPVIAWLTVSLSAASGQDTPAPTPAPTATRAAPIPLPEVATRSDELAVYLKQLEGRVAPEPQIEGIATELDPLAERIRALRARTSTAIAASPGLAEVDDLLAQWQTVQQTLADWNTQLTSRATVLQQEIGGLDELRGIWRATRDAAQASGAPPAVLDRIKSTLASIQQMRRTVDDHREETLVLQDRVVQETAHAREGIDALNGYRGEAVGRLLVRDGQPIWDPARWQQSWAEALAPAQAQFAEGLPQLREYGRVQWPRLPLQLALFVLLLLLWRQARQRTGGWLAEDSSLAPVAAVFEHPVASALFLTLLATVWIYPQPPLLLRQAVRIAAVPPLLRVIDRLVDRPILPGLLALGVFFIVDQVRGMLTPAPLLEQLLFLAEVLTGVLILVWLRRSGRIQRLAADLTPRTVAFLDGGARVLIVLLTLALLAGMLGFMQLARFAAGAVLNSGYAAMLLYAIQRLAQGVWAYLLRTRAARQLRIVQHYRSLLQRRGEQAISWTAAGLWVLAVLASTELLIPARERLYRALTAPLRIGSFSISLGDLVAFGVTVLVAFVLSRFIRFLLQEDIYPRVRLARGLPYALSTILHYTILLIGFLMALAAAGLELDRFALLAGAFGVGIGFGLQNVVNNFVSGLILLFERPLQVGDTVDIGDNITGEISRIGIRSSTVRTGEGAEVIVPNGRLIADPVVNWTLSDRLRRIDLGIGLPYGTDPEQAIQTMRGVAAAHPLVLESPAPTAVFAGFGDTMMNFELRAWTDRFDQWVLIRSELAVALTRAFGQAGILMRPNQLPPKPLAP